MPLIFKPTGSAVIAYARWRDSTRSQRTRRIGEVSAERYGDRWRSRRGTKPDGVLTIDEARDEARRIEADHAAKLAEPEPATKPTFKALVWAWHAHGRDVAGWRPSTVQGRSWAIKRHLADAFGDGPASAITHAQVRDWFDGLHGAERDGGRLSNRNCNLLLTETRAAFNWAIKRDLAYGNYGITANPTNGIAKHRERTNERPSFYTVEQVEALVRSAASDQDALAFKIAAYAGLRRGELVSLRWRCVDLVKASLYIDESVSAGIDATPKSGKGRTVPMAPQLAQALARAQPHDADSADGNGNDLVLVGEHPGIKIDGSALRRRFVAARVRAGLPPLRLHDLRHTFGSLAVDGGASLVQVQAWLGHADLATTARYLHTASRTTDAELLGRAFTAGTADELTSGVASNPVASNPVASNPVASNPVAT